MFIFSKQYMKKGEENKEERAENKGELQGI
jgi:hypothetical protein